MYKAYMITYDLDQPGQDYDEVIKTIKSFGAYVKYWKSSFLVRTKLTPNEMVDKIKPHLDSNDSMIIIEVKNNKQGWLNKKQWNFINENILD